MTMHIVCSDMEGVYTPEIWIGVAEKTGIPELRLTTRDISDYNVLMKKRLSILAEHKITIHDIQEVVAEMEPLPGALDFLDWLRARMPVIIVSDTYTQFAGPLMEKLGWPTLFCHTLTIGGDGAVLDYNLRHPDAKRETVHALKRLNYDIIAIGDSYNDIPMLQDADAGILFNPPETVTAEYPQFPVTRDYAAVRDRIGRLLEP
jgi:phosphoserine / homoserine phosphotransferase